MGNHVKARPRAKPKPKSIKAKINRKMGSKRRTQRMGKELKKGEKGAAASYLTRAQVRISTPIELTKAQSVSANEAKCSKVGIAA